MKRIIATLGITTLLASGCATVKLITSLHMTYGGKWASVDTTHTNAPSGAHLLSMLSNDSLHVRSMLEANGMPDYVKAADPERDLYTVWFAYVDSNMLIEMNRQTGYAFTNSLDNMPSSYFPKGLNAKIEARKGIKQQELESKKEVALQSIQHEHDTLAASVYKMNRSAIERQDIVDIDDVISNADDVATYPAFKGLYLGMNMSDAALILNHYEGLPNKTTWYEANSSNIVKYVIEESVKQEWKNFEFLGDITNTTLRVERVVGYGDVSKLSRLVLDENMLKSIFNISSIDIQQFASRFATAYDLPSPSYSYDDGQTGTNLGGGLTSTSGECWNISDDHKYVISICESKRFWSHSGMSGTDKEIILTYSVLEGSF